MSTIYHRLKELLDQGLPVAMATITQARGSVPREVGAKMIVHPYGQHVGTVGGGCGEADVIRAGLDTIQEGEPRTVHVDLTDDISMQSLGVCGGVMSLFVEQPLEPALLEALLAAIDRREPAALLTVTAAEGALAPARGRHAVLRPEQEPSLVGDLGLGDLTGPLLQDAGQAIQAKEHRLLRYQTEDGSVQVFVEVQARPPHLIIVGAGHIAVPLAAVAKIADFQVTVLDDRPQYAHPGRFPTADRVVAGPFREELARLRQGRPTFDSDTYIVLVTRGHQHDVACLLEVLDDPVAYIGMIGSQRRIRAVYELLEREQGIPAEKFDRIHAPVGLDIGAITPAEIAVAIMAEVINVRRGGRTPGLSQRIREERQARRRRVAPAQG